MNRSQLIRLIENYFRSIGVESSQLGNILNLDNISQALVKCLPNVCIRRHNRTSSSNQSHIHITGDDRFVFYDTITQPTENERISVSLINANLRHLQNIEVSRRNHFVYNSDLITSDYSVDYSLELLETYTHKKVAGRVDSDYQVQISNIRLDDECFIELRDATFAGDTLIFLQQISNPNHYLVMVIPHLEHSDIQINNRSQRISMEEHNSNPVTENSTEPSISRSRFNLTEVTSQTIANFSRNNVDNSEEDSLFDLSVANELRAERTERHQDIVRELATILENANMRIYEGNIDCLAIKENELALIFEVKTLNGTVPDESSQVRKALSQLLYYERFATQEFMDADFYKFAVFEQEISTEHIEFLESYDCLVLYYKEGSITGSEHACQIFYSYINDTRD